VDCSASKQDSAVIITVAGRLDANTAPEFKQECDVWIQRNEHHLVVDFAGLSYISSAGLRSILSLTKALKQHRGTLAICGMKDMVAEVFTVSGFSSYIPVFPSVEEALTGVCS